jgi:hypothetical protein
LKEILQLRKQITDLLRTNITAFAGVKYQEKLEPPSAKQVKALEANGGCWFHRPHCNSSRLVTQSSRD